MISDIFVEQLIRRRPTTATTLLKGLIWVSVVIVTLPLCLSPATLLIAPVALFAAVLLARMLLCQLNLEFEYALTNHELDISMIVGQKKRTEMVSLGAKDIELMAPVGDAYHEQLQNTAIATTYNATSADDSPERWFILFRKNGKLMRLFLEPNNRLVEGIERYNPGAVHHS